MSTKIKPYLLLIFLTLLFWSTACTLNRIAGTQLPVIDCRNDDIRLDRAIVEPRCISTAMDFEKQLNSREAEEPPPTVSWYEVVSGTTPVIITAPHATRPFRDGARRFSDGGGTAALAVAVAQLSGATAIYTTYEGPSDPNYYDDNEFKTSLAELIADVQPKLILDIHGSHPYRSYDIDLGSMGGDSLLGDPSIVERLIASLRNEGVSSISLNRFGASKNETITKYSTMHGVPAVQLEINATWITPNEGDIQAQRFSKLVQAITRVVLHYRDSTAKH